MEDRDQQETQPVPEEPRQSAETDSISSTNHEDMNSTGENLSLEDNQPAVKKTKPRSRSLTLLISLSLVVLVVIAATSAVAGYSSGINERTNLEGTQIAQHVSEQYELGLQDLEANRYELARQRFEYVIRLDPNYPGVTEKLALVLLELNTTATPTIVPTPTLTPTPDLRGAEELFSQAQILLADGKWTEAIETLLKLRKDDPDYQTVKVDSMFYVALRNRGVERILQEGDLEGGTYDLALAEKFGLLDIEASNMRTWADLYKTGASFWGLDWGQAVYYFGQVIVVAPNLRDNTNMTASERYRISAIKYGDVLAANKEWCLAQQQYEAAFSIGPDPSVEPTAAWVTQKCKKSEEKDTNTPAPTPPEATPTPTPIIEVTPTPTPIIEVTPTGGPTEEPTPTPTPEPTQEPSTTPTPQ